MKQHHFDELVKSRIITALPTLGKTFLQNKITSTYDIVCLDTDDVISKHCPEWHKQMRKKEAWTDVDHDNVIRMKELITNQVRLWKEDAVSRGKSWFVFTNLHGEVEALAKACGCSVPTVYFTRDFESLKYHISVRCRIKHPDRYPNGIYDASVRPGHLTGTIPSDEILYGWCKPHPKFKEVLVAVGKYLSDYVPDDYFFAVDLYNDRISGESYDGK